MASHFPDYNFKYILLSENANFNLILLSENFD